MWLGERNMFVVGLYVYVLLPRARFCKPDMMNISGAELVRELCDAYFIHPLERLDLGAFQKKKKGSLAIDRAKMTPCLKRS
jgi:hypothetical protein